MRKTLLIAAAALASSVISSQAQVYSQNIVGYINVPLTGGAFSVLANQLDYDGTGTNNTVATVFGTNLVVNTVVYAWEPSTATYSSAKWSTGKSGLSWGGATNAISAALNSGAGVFIDSPATNNLTLVGTVLQGTNLITLTPGFNFVSSVAPITGGVSTTLGYTPKPGDIVYVFNPSAQDYNQSKYSLGKNGLAWGPSEPQLSVAQPFFIVTTNSETWTNVFTSN